MDAFKKQSKADLLRLKKIARRHRTAPGDAEDIAFLEGRRPRRRGFGDAPPAASPRRSAAATT